MQKLLFAFLSVCLIVSCSTTPNRNGGTNTTLVPITPTNLLENPPTYSNQITVTTNATSANFPSFTTSCGQTWTTQNLSVSRYRNGDVIPKVTDVTQWRNLTTGAWCWYNNDSINYSQYGKLYNWYAVNDSRGLAPTGWHVPTDAEWNKLVKCIDPAADTTTLEGSQSATAGGAMKEAGTSHWLSPNTGATNSSGFAGLPGAFRNSNGTFDFIGTEGNWWSSTEYETDYACNHKTGGGTSGGGGGTSGGTVYRTGYAWSLHMAYDYAYVGRFYEDETHGFSVRLVRD